MIPSRSALLRFATAVLVLAAPLAAVAARKGQDTHDAATLALLPVDPAFVAMLGSAVPEPVAVDLAARLRVKTGDVDAPLASRLAPAPSAAGTRYEASGLALSIRTVQMGDFAVADAHVALTPSADGRSCHFELSGVPFGGASRVETSGTVTWSSGPAGGHGLDALLELSGAPVEAMRAALPGRFDPSISGLVSVKAKASGVIGEATTEDAPATPLRGQVEVNTDWTVVGRSAPLAVTTDFSMDDRMVRVTGGHLKWQDFDLPLQGWLETPAWGKFDLTATFTGIDSKKVAAQWNVPAEWTPSSTLAGRFTWKGKPGDSILRYEATAPSLDLPAWGGWPVHIEGAKLSGGILEVNYDASASVSAQSWTLGGLQLPAVPVGLQWWRGALTIATAKTTVWEGTGTASMGYKPAEHPAFSMSGALMSVKAPPVASTLMASLGLDVDGRASMAWTFGQDAERHPKWTVHGSLMSGRLGNVDLVGGMFAALAAADPSLKLADAEALVPRPKTGNGTRIDRLFLEVEKKDGAFELGGIAAGSGDFGFAGDGRWSAASGLAVDGAITVPDVVAARLVAAAPWAAPLRSSGGWMLVPVTLRGSTSAPVVALDPAWAALLAQARRGEAVTAPAPKDYRHVGVDNLATIPGDPNRALDQ